jgi:hypothetical protein
LRQRVLRLLDWQLRRDPLAKAPARYLGRRSPDQECGGLMPPIAQLVHCVAGIGLLTHNSR